MRRRKPRLEGLEALERRIQLACATEASQKGGPAQHAQPPRAPSYSSSRTKTSSLGSAGLRCEVMPVAQGVSIRRPRSPFRRPAAHPCPSPTASAPRGGQQCARGTPSAALARLFPPIPRASSPSASVLITSFSRSQRALTAGFPPRPPPAQAFGGEEGGLEARAGRRGEGAAGKVPP